MNKVTNIRPRRASYRRSMRLVVAVTVSLLVTACLGSSSSESGNALEGWHRNPGVGPTCSAGMLNLDDIELRYCRVNEIFIRRPEGIPAHFLDITGMLGTQTAEEIERLPVIRLFFIYTDELTIRAYAEGFALTGQVVIDYFASEFEPDGTRRLYDSGRHLAMARLVRWHSASRQWRNGFLFSLQSDLANYLRTMGLAGTHPWDGTGLPLFLQELSTPALDGLIRMQLDPDYVADLVALQQQEG